LPRWAALCRQRDICPPVDALVAGYLGWERPVRETAIKIDQVAEDAAFAETMRAFGSTAPEAFNVDSLTGQH
jgi:hypothetical protein